MDPLSITASIAGVLSLAGSVISTGYAIVSKLKNRGDCFNALVNEIATFSGILVGIQAQAVTADTRGSSLHQTDGPTIQDALQSCNKILKEAEKLFNSLKKANTIKFLMKKDVMKEQIDQIISRVEHYKSFFVLYLQLQSGAQSDEIGKGVLDIKEQLRTLQSGQSKLERYVDAKNRRDLANKRTQIFRWLGPTTDGEHDEICRRRNPESAQWILEREELQAWLSLDKSSYFWLYGIQGTGKTVIVADLSRSSKVIETIENIFLGDNGVALAYYYCRFSNSTPLSSERILGAIISQLLQKEGETQDIPQFLLKLYDKYSLRETLPTLEELNRLFEELCQSVSKLFLVIDGLDELTDRKEIIQLLQRLSEIPHVNFKVFVASRPEIDLEMAFEFYCTIAITPSDNARDIEQYARSRVNKLQLQDQIEADELIRELVHRADGMFLWVVCQLDQLSRVRTAISTDLLRGLPKGLEETFESGLLKLEDDDRMIALEILRWLMYSRRPLSLEELVEAIAVNPGMTNLTQVQKAKVRRASDIFEICGSLVRQSKLSGKLSLAHYSIYEWLSSPQLATGLPNQFHLDSDVSNISMLSTCITYLNLDDYGSAEFLHRVEKALAVQSSGLDLQMLAHSPFLDYASNYWWTHLKGLEDLKLEKVVTEILDNFFKRPLNFDSWAGIARYLHGKHQYPEGMAPIHVAALHGIKCLGIFLLDASLTCRDSTTSDGRRPLHIALESGSDELVDLLVSREASLDAADTKGRRPLHIAIQSGNAVAVTQLVSAGAAVNAPLPDGGTALSIAIENNWDELAVFLSEMASKKPLEDGRYLLHVAAQSGSLAWTTSLLKFHNEMLDMADGNSWTALHYAVDQGHENIVSHLLGENCLPGQGDRNGWTPLHAAVRSRQYSCAALLLNALERRGSPLRRPIYETPAQHVTGTNHSNDDLPESSLPRRPTLDQKYGGHYREDSPNSGAASTSAPGGRISRAVPSPLRVAVSESDPEGVLLLLQYAGLRDIGLDDMSACLRTALTLLDTTILDILIAAADDQQIRDILPSIAARNSDKTKAALLKRWPAKLAHTFLRQFVVSAQPSAVNFILNTWTLPSKQLLNDLLFKIDGKSWSQDKKEVFGLIINSGAALDSRNSQGRPVLQTAIYHENWAFVEFLLEHGDRCGDDPRSSSGETALLFLARHACRDIAGQMRLLKRLVSDGADLNAVDYSGVGIYRKAAAADNDVLLRWLLGCCGELLDDPVVNIQTAMSTAVEHGSEMAAKIILEKIATEPYQVLEMLAGHKARPSVLIAPIEQGNIKLLSLLVGAVNDAFELVAHAEEHINIKRTRYTEALCTTITRRFRPGFDFLLQHVPDVSHADPESGETPLHLAAYVFPFGNVQGKSPGTIAEDKSGEYYVEALLHKGARVDAKTLKSGKTTLDMAIFTGKTKLVKILLEHGAKPTWEHFQKAIENENLGLVTSLLAYGTGFDPDRLPLTGVKNLDLVTILLEQGPRLEPSHLILAAKLGNLPMLIRVLEAFPSDRETQFKAFCVAKYRGHHEIISFLARQVGESIDEDLGKIQPDTNGGTLLHSAVRRRQPSEVEILLRSSCGNDQEYLMEKDKEGKTALILAMSICHWGSATLLIRANAGVQEARSWARSTKVEMWIDQLEELIKTA
ncbi:hypothetical protein ZTR_11270 [Talaromyces verruculosus]|nr:hypothetical protein ZTR_11270 [Talaromyces verruculosus]